MKQLLYGICTTVLGLSLVGMVMAAGPTGTFIQLNRGNVARSVDDWSADMSSMKGIGITHLIIQWCSEPSISYFETESLPHEEQYDAVAHILSAAADQKMTVTLGLQQDPFYWSQITARDRVLRDYFLTRVARHAKVQAALLERFGGQAAWTGYYIPDEIDDLTWRQPGKAKRVKDYVALMCRVLREHDASRPISISAFFRSRTAPDVFVASMRNIISTNSVDKLLLQDGLGNEDPAPRYIPLYYEAFQKAWPADYASLGCVIEVFNQVSAMSEPFKATPATPERVRIQLDHASKFFSDLILFTYSDYANPALGEEAKKLYDSLKP